MPFPGRGAVQEDDWRRHPALLLAVGLFVLRSAYLPWINLYPEEAYYWNYSRHLDYGYLDHPPMVAWLIYLGTACFGHTELGVRFFALACSLVTSFFAFRLTALLSGRQAGWMAVLLVQLLPFFFMNGWIMTPDAPLTACWAGMLYFLALVTFRGESAAWLGVGICLGIGMLSKYTIGLLGPATLLLLALDVPSRVWFGRLTPYASALIAAGIFSPVIAWNAAHHWASFAFQSMGRLQEAHHFALPALLGSILLLLTPLGVILAEEALMTRTDIVPDLNRQRLFARVFVLVPLAVFLIFSVSHQVKLNWTGPLWLAVVPEVAVRLETMTAAARWRRAGYLLTLAVLFAGYGSLLQYLSFGLPGLPYAGNIALLPVGWPELSHSLERQKSALQQASSVPVLVVGLDRDFIASEAAFYQTDQTRAVRETTGPHLFGGRSLMYAYWFPSQEQNGDTLLLASFNRQQIDSEAIYNHVRSLGPIRTSEIQVHGKAVCTFYTRPVYGYHRSRPRATLRQNPGAANPQGDWE